MSLRTHQGLLATGAALAYSGFDPANKGASAVLENGNFDLYAAGTSTNRWALSKAKRSAGKWRIQFVHVVHTNTAGAGFALAGSIGTYLGKTDKAAALFGNYPNKRLYLNNSYTTYPGEYANGSIEDVYLDLDNGRAWWAVDGVIVAGNPAAGTGAMATFAAGVNVWAAADATGAGGRLRIRTNPADIVGAGIAGFINGWPDL